MTQLVQFDGQTHAFPDDFSSDEISGALASYQAPAPAAGPAAAPWPGMYQPENFLDFAGHLPREIGDLAHVAATPALRQQIWSGLTGADGQPRYQLGPERLARSVVTLPADVASGRLPTPGINDRSPDEDTATPYLSRAQDLLALAMPGWSPRGAISSGLGGDLEHLAEERPGLPPSGGAPPGGQGAPPGGVPPIGGAGGAGSAPPPGSRGAAMVQALAPDERAALDAAVARGGTPEQLLTANDTAHPEQMLGELTPSLAADTGALASVPGAAKQEITGALAARADATPQRLDELLTDTFGEPVNVAQQIRDLKTAQAVKSGPAYDFWNRTLVAPSPAIDALMPRLEAAGAVASAQKRLAIRGVPTQQSMAPSAPGALGRMMPASKSILSSADLGLGDPAMKTVTGWTPAAYDAMKQDLGAKVSAALRNEDPGKARDYAQLSAELVGALDNHPGVGDAWKVARQTWAAPERVLDAQKLGLKFFDPRRSLDELQVRMAGASEAEKDGFMSGLRDAASHTLRGSVRGEANLRNAVSSPEAKAKIAWAVGRGRADRFSSAIEQEAEFPKSSNAIIGGSPTQPRTEAAKNWTVQPSRLSETVGDLLKESAAGPVVGGAMKLLGASEPVSMLIGGAAYGAQKLYTRAAEAAAERIRDAVAPIVTLKGADRAAALHKLLAGRKDPR